MSKFRRGTVIQTGQYGSEAVREILPKKARRAQQQQAPKKHIPVLACPVCGHTSKMAGFRWENGLCKSENACATRARERDRDFELDNAGTGWSDLDIVETNRGYMLANRYGAYVDGPYVDRDSAGAWAGVLKTRALDRYRRNRDAL